MNFFFIMSQPDPERWRCSRQYRCLSRNHSPLTGDNFRKGSTLPECNRFFKTCNRCRKKGSVPKSVDVPFTPKKRCSHCHANRRLVFFLDDQGISSFLKVVLISKGEHVAHVHHAVLPLPMIDHILPQFLHRILMASHLLLGGHSLDVEGTRVQPLIIRQVHN